MTAPIPALVNRFCTLCQEDQPVEKSEEVITALLTALQTVSPLERWNVAHRIRQECTKNDLYKQAICKGKEGNWRDLILQTHFERKIESHGLFLQYDNSLTLPLKQEGRSRSFSHDHLTAVLGSTFATNRPSRLDKKGHSLLDVLFAATCGGGYALSIADGAGGHFGDIRQDQNIARAAHTATKTCVRLFSTYENPDLLLKDLPSLLKVICKEVERKGKGEGCTLVGCRAFPVQGGFRLIAFNIGDSMLFAWNHSTKALQNLLPARVTEGGTALLPHSFKAFELISLDTLLPEGSRLFLATDGIHDMLPFSEAEGSYPNGLLYRTRSIADFKEEVTLKTILQSCFEKAEKERLAKVALPDQSLGDDFALLECVLKGKK